MDEVAGAGTFRLSGDAYDSFMGRYSRPLAAAFADFVGNGQYISVGNLDENNKAFIFLMDYPNRRRIKIWGTAKIVEGDAEVTHLSLSVDEVGALIECQSPVHILSDQPYLVETVLHFIIDFCKCEHWIGIHTIQSSVHDLRYFKIDTCGHKSQISEFLGPLGSNHRGRPHHRRILFMKVG